MNGEFMSGKIKNAAGIANRRSLFGSATVSALNLHVEEEGLISVGAV